jgi:hypothetical protein
LGEPLAVLSAGIPLMKRLVDLDIALIEMQATLLCWPHCALPVTLAAWVYR